MNGGYSVRCGAWPLPFTREFHIQGEGGIANGVPGRAHAFSACFGNPDSHLPCDEDVRRRLEPVPLSEYPKQYGPSGPLN